MNTAQPIATSDRVSFWLVGSNVYRVNLPFGIHFANESAFDAYGNPLGMRWECSLDHWKHYRACFEWAQDIDATSTNQIEK